MYVRNVSPAVRFRLLVFVVLLMGCFPTVAGAVELRQPASSPYDIAVGQGFLFTPSGMAVGDLNHDGRSDVVTSNWSPDSYSVMLANADGSLSRQAGSPNALTRSPNDVTLGDFDDDGDLDAAFASAANAGEQTASVTIYAGDGTGAFAANPAASLPAGVNPGGIATGDLNGDGIDDVAVTDYDGDRVYLFTGVAGSLNMTPYGSYAVGTSPLSIAVGDFNGDGQDDVATANYGSFFSEAFTVLVSDGAGGYVRTPPSGLEGSYKPWDIVAGRFDGSGNLGLAEGNTPNSDISVKLGVGDGTFTDAPSPSIDSHFGGPLASADFNADGIDDIVAPYGTAVSGPSDRFALFLGTADGAMDSAPGSPFTLSPFSGPQYADAGDFNGDGLPDFAAVNFGTQVAVFLNAVPKIAADPESVDFGAMPVGGSAVSRTVTIKSTGDLDLHVSSLGIDGDDASDFEVVDQDCTDAPIQPGGHCEVDLRFGAAALGARQANLKVVSDAGNSGTLTVPLTGTGSANPGISVDPDAGHFPGVPVGLGPSTPIEFDVFSTGITPLEIGTITISGTGSGQFHVDADACSGHSLAPGEHCTVSVVLDPTQLGEHMASLDIPSNLGQQPTAVPLDGWGSPNPGIELSPGDADFGDAPANGEPGTPQSFTVSSTGTTPLEIDDVGLGGNDPGQFRIVSDDCKGQSVSPQGGCEIAVAFAPGSPGGKAAKLEVTTNAGDGPETADLTGTGTALPTSPGIAVDPATTDFGRIVVGEGPSATHTITVKSTGDGALSIGTPTVAGGDAEQFRVVSDGCASRELQPDATCPIEVAFAPTEPGSREARLEIPSNASGSPAVVSLSGTADAKPTPCEPVSVKRVVGYKPAVKRHPKALGVRVRLTTTAPAFVRVRAKVKIWVRGHAKTFKSSRQKLSIKGAYRNYKVALPGKLRRKAKVGGKAVFTVFYSSRAVQSGCEYGPERSRMLRTKVVWVRPSRP